jgi:hypothetical protein
MNARFFALAFSTLLNPKLLGLDLLLIANRRPRLMFLCFLLGGMGMGITIGLLDVLVLRVDAVKIQNSLSATADLALGLALIAIGVLVGTGRVHGRRKAPVAAGAAPAEPKEGWMERSLREPRPGLAILIGALAGTPGAAYVTALKQLVTGGYPTSTQVVGVFVFNLIQFSPVLIPFALLAVWPEATEQRLRGLSDWIIGHARQIIAWVALAVGAYMTITGFARVL